MAALKLIYFVLFLNDHINQGSQDLHAKSVPFGSIALGVKCQSTERRALTLLLYLLKLHSLFFIGSEVLRVDFLITFRRPQTLVDSFASAFIYCSSLPVVSDL